MELEVVLPEKSVKNAKLLHGCVVYTGTTRFFRTHESGDHGVGVFVLSSPLLERFDDGIRNLFQCTPPICIIAHFRV